MKAENDYLERAWATVCATHARDVANAKPLSEEAKKYFAESPVKWFLPAKKDFAPHPIETEAY